MVALCASLGSTGPVLAQSGDGILASANRCLLPATDIDGVVTRLQADAWTVTSPVPDASVEMLVWPLIAGYFASDSGGETLQTIHELQQKTMRAYTQKQDIPASKSRVLTRDTDAVHVLWRKTMTGGTEIECRFAVDAPRMQDIRTHAGLPSETGEDLKALPQINSSEAHSQRYVQITLLNRAALAQKIGQSVIADATINTYQSFGFQE